MRSSYGVTWFCALIQREKGGFTSVFRNGVKVQSRHSRQVFEPLCDTHAGARAVDGGEGTNGRTACVSGCVCGEHVWSVNVFNGDFGRVRS